MLDNAEELLHSLEEFSKLKPKLIPRELEDYICYVAKTGDPVFKWSLIKLLFREKMLSVINDFYEDTLTIDIPPCPNVDAFNYDRMKTNLLERFEYFHGAPFTIQRICELLTNPRKEYSRADKFMRAIEKNILVVSTREPGRFSELDFENAQECSVNGVREGNDTVDSTFIINELGGNTDSSSSNLNNSLLVLNHLNTVKWVDPVDTQVCSDPDSDSVENCKMLRVDSPSASTHVCVSEQQDNVNATSKEIESATANSTDMALPLEVNNLGQVCVKYISPSNGSSISSINMATEGQELEMRHLANSLEGITKVETQKGEPHAICKETFPDQECDKPRVNKIEETEVIQSLETPVSSKVEQHCDDAVSPLDSVECGTNLSELKAGCKDMKEKSIIPHRGILCMTTPFDTTESSNTPEVGCLVDSGEGVLIPDASQCGNAHLDIVPLTRFANDHSDLVSHTNSTSDVASSYFVTSLPDGLPSKIMAQPVKDLVHTDLVQPPKELENKTDSDHLSSVDQLKITHSESGSQAVTDQSGNVQHSFIIAHSDSLDEIDESHKESADPSDSIVLDSRGKSVIGLSCKANHSDVAQSDACGSIVLSKSEINKQLNFCPNSLPLSEDITRSENASPSMPESDGVTQFSQGDQMDIPTELDVVDIDPSQAVQNEFSTSEPMDVDD